MIIDKRRLFRSKPFPLSLSQPLDSGFEGDFQSWQKENDPSVLFAIQKKLRKRHRLRKAGVLYNFFIYKLLELSAEQYKQINFARNFQN